ncbi:MAG TPA: dephospho-CoA kinase [Streptosporangiaceae bacterium]
MLKVGLTGGIAAGKSEVSRRLAERGAVIIDADAVAREVVAPGTRGLAEITAAFGPGVLDAGGALDRGRLGEIVFADSALLGKLNAIVHPWVAERMLEIERAAPPDAIVVHDVPLLAENRLAGQYDVVVVVDVPAEVQLDRLTRQRRMPEDQARERMDAQASRAERLEIADIVVDNSGSLADLDRRVDGLWEELTARGKN